MSISRRRNTHLRGQLNFKNKITYGCIACPIGECLPKVGVLRRRDSKSQKKVAFRVDETTMHFGSVHFA